MDEKQIFILSEQAMANTVDQIGDQQFDLRPPEWFQTSGNADVSLRDLLAYHAFDSAWVPDVLAGRTIAEVGDKYDGDLLGSNPRASYRAYSERAAAAVEELTDLDTMVHLSYGDFPAREYLKHVTSFRGFRAYEIARRIGADTALPDDLVQGMWEEIEPDADTWRQMGVFGPAVEVPTDAPLQDRLLGLAGRDPYY